MADTIDEMNGTLDDILSLARLGRPSEPVTEVDLAALVDAVVEDFRDLGKPVEFAEVDRIKMRLRPSLMRRAVRNLIENAVKYGGGAEVFLRPSAHAVEITVCDRGPGIPTERIGEVFEAFTRLESSRNKETGGHRSGASAGQCDRARGGRRHPPDEPPPKAGWQRRSRCRADFVILNLFQDSCTDCAPSGWSMDKRSHGC